MNLALLDSRPIVACSSGPLQNSAIALIRLSGFNDFNELAHFFTGPMGPLSPLKVREAVFCHLVQGTKVLDQVVLTYFKAPRSFTGENLLELGVHGNQVNIQRILELFTLSGSFRLAQPGEFTYRALKNNKMSLSEAEGLGLFLNAPSKGVLDQAAKLMGGELTQAYLDLRSRFLKLKASVELSLDFLMDVGAGEAEKNFSLCLLDFAAKLSALQRRTQAPLSAITSPDIVLAGRPNTGKSSLFNRFLQQSRAIVSPQEGTTRDYISEHISLEDIQFRLIDTAGIRQTEQSIEQEGIRKSVKLIQQAFFKILLINPDTFAVEELAPFKGIHFDLVLLSFADRKRQGWMPLNLPLNYHYYGHISLESGSIEPGKMVLRSGPIEPLAGPIRPRSLATMEKIIADKYLKLLKEDEILVPRQRALIRECFVELEQFQKLVAEERDMAIISSELNIIGQKIEQLIGLTSIDEVLEGVFSQFCIGK